LQDISIFTHINPNQGLQGCFLHTASATGFMLSHTKLPLLFSLVFSWATIFSQTYTGTGGIITDDGLINDYTIDIQDLSPDILDTNHGLVKVCVNLTHSWVSDLDIRLITPAGTNMMLTSAMGGDGDNMENTCFTMEATEHVISSWAPFSGDFKPFSSLNQANNGSSGLGIWTLRILDTYAYADGGEMLDWSLTFGEEANGNDLYVPTRLPIIVLETDNVTIPNEPKIPGRIQVIYDDTGEYNSFPGNAMFSGNMEIEVRGSSSQSFPKKSYSFETQDENGQELEVPLLGLPEEEDWILYAPYTDKSFLRDALTYYLGNALGGYAPRTAPCELVVNGDYMGVYFLEEKIKRDKNRVDISKLNPMDTLGDELTGGYILKIDRHDGDGTFFLSNFEGSNPDEDVVVVYEEPEGPDLHPKQKEYIQQLFHDFESALYGENFNDLQLGYRRYLDIESLVDYFLVCELGHNVDAYRLSTFFYKDRNTVDSLFHLGPLWDFNLAFGNVDYCECQYVEGWAYVNSTACGGTPLWWGRLMEDSFFRDRVKCRYDSLRQTVLSTASILHYLESQVSLLEGPSIRNYEQWPILGRYVWPNSFIGQTYTEEINYLKQWVNGRLQWMDENIMGECLPVNGANEIEQSAYRLTPNPAVSSFTLQSLSGESMPFDLAIMTTQGIVCKSLHQVYPGEQIDISGLSSGIYMVTMHNHLGKVVQQKLVIL
jgi:subtilisin-like proprotein convertase family protein